MIARLLRRLCRKAPATPAPGALPPSWEAYRAYIDVDPAAIIAPSATLTIAALPAAPRVMLRIGAGSHVFSHFTLLRPEASIAVGARCQLGASQLIAAREITMGDDVLMAWGVTVIDTDTHAQAWAQRRNDVRECYDAYLQNPATMLRAKTWDGIACLPVSIGDRAWIGFNAIILKGVALGAECIVGAGAVVTKSFTDRGVIGGNPARVIGQAPHG